MVKRLNTTAASSGGMADYARSLCGFNPVKPPETSQNCGDWFRA